MEEICTVEVLSFTIFLNSTSSEFSWLAKCEGA